MARRRAFTLIELLVVILIIALLIGVSVMVGKSVVSGGKKSQTENTLRVLDLLLSDYMAREGEIPPAYIEDPHEPGVFMPIIDGRNMSVDEMDTTNPGYQLINSVGLFLFQLESSNASMEALEGIDEDLRRLYTPYSESNADRDNVVHEIPTIFDAWGNPIRYVHPTWDVRFWGNDMDNLNAGASADPSKTVDVADELRVILPDGGEWAIEDVRRNNLAVTPGGDRVDEFPDSDGGVPPTPRPYFYSAGPDGKVGFIDENTNGKLDAGETDFNKDNVYTTKPRFQN